MSANLSDLQQLITFDFEIVKFIMASVLPNLVQSALNLGPTSTTYDLVVVGSGFAGTTTTLNFLEECKKLGKRGKVALIEAGRDGERCGASRW